MVMEVAMVMIVVSAFVPPRSQVSKGSKVARQVGGSDGDDGSGDGDGVMVVVMVVRVMMLVIMVRVARVVVLVIMVVSACVPTRSQVSKGSIHAFCFIRTS